MTESYNLTEAFGALVQVVRGDGGENQKSGSGDATAADKSSPTDNPAPPPAALTDEFKDAKDRLRSLTTWIIGIFGSIAALMVAGSQLSDLGVLDDTSEATLFGWHQTRFEFAVIGLGVMLGGAVLAIVLAVWVQISSRVNLEELHNFPLSPRWFHWLVWRVKARVRDTIEGDLRARGVPPTTRDGTDDRLTTVIDEWHDARVHESNARDAGVAAESEIAKAKLPRLQSGTSLIDADATDTRPIWLQASTLKRIADQLATSEVEEPGPANAAALQHLEDQIEKTFKQSVTETKHHFELVTRVINDASYLRMRYSFSMVLKYLVLTAVACGAGIALFAWATHPPKTDQQRTPTVLILPVNEAKTARTYLGQNCDPTTFKISMLGTSSIAISAASNDPKKTCTLTPPSPAAPK